MRTVWKYELASGLTELSLVAPRVVHVGVDPSGRPDWPCVWIEHAPGDAEVAASTRCMLIVLGTGYEVPHQWQHAGSAVTNGGLVWHVYSRGFDAVG